MEEEGTNLDQNNSSTWCLLQHEDVDQRMEHNTNQEKKRKYQICRSQKAMNEPNKHEKEKWSLIVLVQMYEENDHEHR